MAAPTTTARTTPAGIKLDDGYTCKKAFTADPDVSFWEKSNKPPGIDGGEAIDTTTFFNATYRTMAARALKTLTVSTVKAAYDPNVINNILALVNVEGSVTDHFPDGSTLSYYGFLKSIEFDELVEGQQPECTITVVPTNFDPVARVEAPPVLTSVAGT